MKVTAIEESQDLRTMKMDELIGSLQAFEMTFNDRSEKKVKSIACQSKEDPDEHSLSRAIALISSNFNRSLAKLGNYKKTDVPDIQSDIKPQRKNSDQCKTCQESRCSESKGYGHNTHECSNHLKKLQKGMSSTLSEEELDTEINLAFTSKCITKEDPSEKPSLWNKEEEACVILQQRKLIDILLQKSKEGLVNTDLKEEISLLNTKLTEIALSIKLQSNNPNPSRKQRKKYMSNHMSHHSVQNRRSTKDKIQSRRRKKVCHHCGKEGHIRTFCFELYGFPKFHEQFWNRHTRQVKNAQSKLTCLIAHTSLRVSSKDDWYFDNGCSKHMTGEKAYLQEIKNYSNSYVTFGD
ncbi:gag-protease polyprotein [Trifolium repens]|nr:gag-protease polyprotein [Trifolium repens]